MTALHELPALLSALCSLLSALWRRSQTHMWDTQTSKPFRHEIGLPRSPWRGARIDNFPLPEKLAQSHTVTVTLRFHTLKPRRRDVAELTRKLREAENARDLASQGVQASATGHNDQGQDTASAPGNQVLDMDPRAFFLAAMCTLVASSSVDRMAFMI